MILSMDYRQDPAFCRIYPFVLSLEGGYVSPERAAAIHDTGGATNHGIAYNFNQQALHLIGVDSPDKMSALTKEQAINIYYSKYWLAACCQRVASLKMQLIHFDAAINQGTGAAMWFLGRCGNDFHSYLSLREMAYKGNPALPHWIQSNPATRVKNLQGWMNRLARIEKDAEALA